MLASFGEPTRAWFEAAFAAPTPAQLGAWEAISARRNALVVAPTGSGKTLSAFLWSLDRLAAEPVPEERLHRCRVLYVSPLKALAVDVERNLRAPLTGIRHTAELGGGRRGEGGLEPGAGGLAEAREHAALARRTVCSGHRSILSYGTDSSTHERRAAGPVRKTR